MLNISHNQVNKKVTLERFKAFKKVYKPSQFKIFNRFLASFAIAGLIILFLPWTQNVSGNGFVTTITPDQRPQTIQSPIPGRIEKWYKKEGDFNKNPTTFIEAIDSIRPNSKRKKNMNIDYFFIKEELVNKSHS